MADFTRILVLTATLFSFKQLGEVVGIRSRQILHGQSSQLYGIVSFK
jgi:hypothetical protein